MLTYFNGLPKKNLRSFNKAYFLNTICLIKGLTYANSSDIIELICEMYFH